VRVAVAVAGGLQREQPRVVAAAGDQLVVGAELADPTLAEHGDAIGAAQAAEPVRDQEPRAPRAVAREGAMHAMLGLGVEPRAGLVEQQQVGVRPRQGARERDALPLADREGRAGGLRRAVLGDQRPAQRGGEAVGQRGELRIDVGEPRAARIRSWSSSAAALPSPMFSAAENS